MVVVLLAAVAWLGYRAATVRTDLYAVRDGLTQARQQIDAEQGEQAVATLRSVSRNADSARRATNDPVWRVAAALPVLGDPLETVRGLAQAGGAISDAALPALAEAVESLQPDRLRVRPDTIDLRPLQENAEPLTRAARVLERERRAVAGLPASWVGQIGDARSDVLDQLTPIARSADAVAAAARVAPGMLGGEGLRRYFVAFQQPAESRGTGGLIGAFAILRAEGGKLSVERVAPNSELVNPSTPPEGLDPEFSRRYRQYGAETFWLNTNLSPHFPYAASAWSAFYEATTRTQIDGAIALDPASLAVMLRTTGPVQVAGVGQIGPDNVEDFLGRRQYEVEQDDERRAATLQLLASQVVRAVLDGRGNIRQLAEQLGESAKNRHVQVWSAQPQEQQEIEEHGLGGVVPITDRPFAMLSVTNAAGSKLDYYLDTALRYHVASCSDDRRRVRLTVTLTNSLPPGPLPGYVTIRSDDPLLPTPTGQNRLLVQLFGTSGSRVISAVFGGEAMPVLRRGEVPRTLPGGDAPVLEVGEERAHPVHTVVVELPPRETRTLILEVDEPRRNTRLLARSLALSRPTKITTGASGCP